MQTDKTAAFLKSVKGVCTFLGVYRISVICLLPKVRR